MAKLMVRSEEVGPGRSGPAGGEPSSSALIRIVGVEKRFAARSGEVVTALSDVNLDIENNEFISVVGPSG
jgi:NitT/TauT family transport system ATP-binding protein